MTFQNMLHEIFPILLLSLGSTLLVILFLIGVIKVNESSE